MASDNQARINNLIMARMCTAAELSEWLVGVAACNLDVRTDIAGWARSQRLLRRVEGQSVSLYMQGGGCTWDYLGGIVGVSRQSLHRRLSRPAAKELQQAQQMQSTPSEVLNQHIGLIRQHMRELHRETVQLTSSAIQDWEDYRANKQQRIYVDTARMLEGG